jgi:hypothetical protein
MSQRLPPVFSNEVFEKDRTWDYQYVSALPDDELFEQAKKATTVKRITYGSLYRTIASGGKDKTYGYEKDYWLAIGGYYLYIFETGAREYLKDKEKNKDTALELIDLAITENEYFLEQIKDVQKGKAGAQRQLMGMFGGSTPEGIELRLDYSDMDELSKRIHQHEHNKHLMKLTRSIIDGSYKPNLFLTYLISLIFIAGMTAGLIVSGAIAANRKIEDIKKTKEYKEKAVKPVLEVNTKVKDQLQNLSNLFDKSLMTFERNIAIVPDKKIKSCLKSKVGGISSKMKGFLSVVKNNRKKMESQIIYSEKNHIELQKAHRSDIDTSVEAVDYYNRLNITIKKAVEVCVAQT